MPAMFSRLLAWDPKASRLLGRPYALSGEVVHGGELGGVDVVVVVGVGVVPVEAQAVGGYSSAAREAIYYSMMPLDAMQKPSVGFDWLRRLSGAEIVVILGRFGLSVHSQCDSHVKLRRILADGTARAITVRAPLRMTKTPRSRANLAAVPRRSSLTDCVVASVSSRAISPG